MVGGGFALSGILALASATTPGTDDATGIRIELDAPADCATAEGFYEHVRARTERVRPVAEGETGVRVVVRLTRVGSKAHGELRVIGEHGESDTRRVDGGSCTEVIEALSLTVALAVDPTARLAPPTKSRESAPPPESPPPVPISEPAEPPIESAPPPTPARKLEVLLGAGIFGMGQVTPYVSFGGSLALRFVMPWAAASSFGLAFVHMQNDVFAPANDAWIRSNLFELLVCPKRFGQTDVFTFEPCITGYGGWLNVAGQDVAHAEHVNRSYFALGAKLVARAPLGTHFAVELSLGLAVPVVRRRFVLLEPLRQVAETPSISGLGGVALTYSF